MSCSLHDVARLEELGIPTAFLVTDAFRRSVAEQAGLLGLADYQPVWVEHPVAGLRAPEAQGRADQVVPAVVSVLLGREVRLQSPDLPSADECGAPSHSAGEHSAASTRPTAPSTAAEGPDCTDAACAIDLAELGR